MADDDAIISDSALLAAFVARLAAVVPSVHAMINVLDTPYDMPQNQAHKGFAVALRASRNLMFGRNQTVARMRGEVVVTLLWRLSANATADRADAMDMGATIKEAITDIGWLPDGVVDQIIYESAAYAYHPATRGWYTVALTFHVDYDTDL